MIKFQQSQALTSHFESFWSIVDIKAGLYLYVWCNFPMNFISFRDKDFEIRIFLHFPSLFYAVEKVQALDEFLISVPKRSKG